MIVYFFSQQLSQTEMKKINAFLVNTHPSHVRHFLIRRQYDYQYYINSFFFSFFIIQ
jgi:hypothetical protein